MSETGSGQDESPVISDQLLELLVCPVDKAKVEPRGSALVCTHCGRAYPVENGIPNMLVDDPA